MEVEPFFPGHEAIKPAMTLIKSGNRQILFPREFFKIRIPVEYAANLILTLREIDFNRAGTETRPYIGQN